jgi:hypothetical protein
MTLMVRFKAPTDAEVQNLLVKIPTVQLRRVFYEGLKNPLWIKPLAAAGAFVAPPDPVKGDDGYIRDVYWPEIEYISRVAPEVPGDVVDVLLSLQDSNNAWVRRAVFEIGSKIPATQGVRLKPLLESWKRTGYGWRTDPRDLVSFAVTLLQGGETKTGRWLANELFTPRAPKVEGAFLGSPTIELEEYWYEQGLPRVVEALGDDALRATVGWLGAYVEHSGLLRGDHDASGMLRPLIGERDSSHTGVDDALVEAVRDLAIAGLRNNLGSTAKTLLSSGVHLMLKIAMHAVTVVLRDENAMTGVDPALIELSKRMLSEETPNDTYLRPEYARLAQALAPLAPEAAKVVGGFIDKAYAADLVWLHEYPLNPGTEERESDDEIRAHADRYRHQWLAAIGPDALSTTLREELEKLDSQQGVIDSPLEPVGRITSWSGPNAFSNRAEMATMSPLELVAHLASWHDTGDGWGPDPSHEGQGRELSALLTTRPDALADVPDLVQVLRPTYLRAILQGWSAALRTDQALNWGQVAELIQEVLAHRDESDFPVEGGLYDDDENFRGSKRAAVNLLEELLKRRENVVVPRDFAARFADLLLVDADDEVSWQEYETVKRDREGWDAFTMSLNWSWPQRLRGLVLVATTDLDETHATSALAALERELARSDPHMAGRAVLGEKLGRLLTNQPRWLKTHLDEYFGTSAGVSREQQVALTTAVAVHHYHRDLYELLAGAMISAAAVGEELVGSWRGNDKPLQKIGEWVINALNLGHATLSDPLPHAFFERASPEARGDALGSIAWSFFHTSSDIDASIRDRFADLWDERIQHVREYPSDRAELHGFFWCAKGKHFAVSWWLPRMREVLTLDSDAATARLMIGKELAVASSADAACALSVVRLLVDAREGNSLPSFDLMRHAIPIVIGNAILIGDAETKAEAESFMNELGAKGYLNLESEVEAVVDGTVTSSDMPEI